MEGICDFDSGKLIRRIDDDPKMVKLRINEYLNDITQQFNYYQRCQNTLFLLMEIRMNY